MVPYFRPEALEHGAWPVRVTSCYGTYKVGVNIKREMVLSLNDEEAASPKKHTQFSYPISDQNDLKTMPLGAEHTYTAHLYKGVSPPPGEKRVADYESHCLRMRE